MKKLTLALALCAMTLLASAQSLSDPNLIFYGLDFSKAKLIGEGFSNPQDIKDRFFVSWNGFFRSDDKDYDLAAALKKTGTVDLENVDKHNKAVNIATLTSQSDYSITPDQAESVIKDFETGGKKALGCVFVVESFDKSKQLASVYVVFFDNASKKVLLTKKIETSPSGFGLKNYWANSVRLVINDCKKQFPKWVKGK